MMDWYAVVVNSFWIFGLSVLLAAFSYHHWLAPLENRPLREQLRQPSFVRLFWLGFSLVLLGLAGTSKSWWEAAIWILFLLISVVYAFKIQQDAS